MNDLNSILLEGYNIDSPIDGCFTLLSKKLYIGYVEETLIKIKTLNKLKDLVTEHLPNNIVRRMRIVGGIRSNESGVYILAEHIEFKPIKNGEQLNLF